MGRGIKLTEEQWDELDHLRFSAKSADVFRNCLIVLMSDSSDTIGSIAERLGCGTDTGMCPTLSFVQVPSQEMGSAGVALLDQIIRGAVFPPVTRVLRARLVIRQSCGCKPAPSEESSPSSAE